MRGYVVNTVVILSFEGASCLWSGTAVCFFFIVLVILTCLIKGKKPWKTAMRGNGEIVTKCGQVKKKGIQFHEAFVGEVKCQFDRLRWLNVLQCENSLVEQFVYVDPQKIPVQQGK